MRTRRIKCFDNTSIKNLNDKRGKGKKETRTENVWTRVYKL